MQSMRGTVVSSQGTYRSSRQQQVSQQNRKAFTAAGGVRVHRVGRAEQRKADSEHVSSLEKCKFGHEKEQAQALSKLEGKTRHKLAPDQQDNNFTQQKKVWKRQVDFKTAKPVDARQLFSQRSTSRPSDEKSESKLYSQQTKEPTSGAN